MRDFQEVRVGRSPRTRGMWNVTHLEISWCEMVGQQWRRRDYQPGILLGWLGDWEGGGGSVQPKEGGLLEAGNGVA